MAQKKELLSAKWLKKCPSVQRGPKKPLFNTEGPKKAAPQYKEAEKSVSLIQSGSKKIELFIAKRLKKSGSLEQSGSKNRALQCKGAQKSGSLEQSGSENRALQFKGAQKSNSLEQSGSKKRFLRTERLK